ncbi:MAG TPA: YceI family protein [Candidatus Dormibacteraeota bacterium]|nr:YceI family protein [Candidatus Dormibacteraeota bacterium]
MPRRIWIPFAAAIALMLLGGAGVYAYFFSGLRSTPPPLSLATPAASTSATASASAPATAGTVTWSIATGSLVGYRVNEQFVGQSSSHQAVARTSDVTGKVVIAQSGSTYEMTSATITVQLASLASVDSVAGYNVTNRDRIVQQSLDVRSFPTATFTTQSVALPAGADSAQAVTVSVPGQLTVRGVTKQVTATIQLRVTGNSAQIAGTVATNMTDFGVSPPTIGFTTVQPAVTIEFSLNLATG